MNQSSQTRHILMVHPHDCFNPSEPWTIRIMALAIEFVNSGHRVTLAYHPLDDFLTKPFIHEGINMVPLRRHVSFHNFFSKFEYFLQLLQHADIAYLQKSFHYASIPLVFASWKTDKFFHYDWDDDEWAIYKNGGKYPSYLIGILLKTIERMLVYFADSISVSSEKLRHQVICRRPDFKSVVKVWVGAFPHRSDFKKQAHIRHQFGLLNTISFVYAGQLHGGQYVEKLIHIFKNLKDRGLEFKCLIIGEGHQQNVLEKLSESLGLSQNVHFTGSIQKPVLFDFIQSCDLALAAFSKNDITESKSPLKIAEYLTLGMPVISDNVGEVEAMLDGNGLLIDPDKPEDLEQAIATVLQNPDSIKHIRDSMKQRSVPLTWKQSAHKILSLWKDRGVL